MESSTAVQAHERATGSSTIADLIGLAAERYGDSPAIRHKRDGAWHDVSYARARRDRVRGRPRADRPRHRARRPRGDPLHDAAGVDLRGLRHHAPPAPSSSRSTRRTRPRSASGSRATPSRARSSARTPSRWRRSAPSAGDLPALETIIVIDPAGERRRRDPARRRCASAAAARDPAELAERARGRHARPALHDHLHVGHDRAAEGLRAQPRQLPRRRARCASRTRSCRRATSPTCSCRSRTRSRC